jgi:hypothetical protein
VRQEIENFEIAGKEKGRKLLRIFNFFLHFICANFDFWKEKCIFLLLNLIEDFLSFFKINVLPLNFINHQINFISYNK